MSDEPPPLVDYPGQQPYANAGWPTHGTPMFGMGHFPAPVQPEWGGFGTPWAAPSAGVLTPMFPAAQPVQQPPPGWAGPSPAVTQVPFPTGTVAQGNDDWVHVQPAPGEAWPVEPKGSLSNRFASMMSSPSRSMSKRSSSRPLSPFSTDSSSPSSRHSDLTRSASWTSSVDENTKRPPREWRSDFSMSRSPRLGAAIGSLLHLSPRPRSASRRGSLSSPKVTLNPYIRYSSSRMSMFLDLREPPPRVRFLELPRDVSEWDLMRYACEPPLPVMVFYSPAFPWYIEARTQNPVGVTLYEMFMAIWQCMMTPISHEDYYNNEMDQEARELIALAWAQRCGENQEERNKGIRRVDFLMEKVGLEGVTKGKDGYFELKIKKV